jgi:hypothetical protein
MFEQHVKAGEMDEAEQVFDVVFPAGDEPAEVVHPGEEPFYFSSPAIIAAACVRPESYVGDRGG